MVPDSPDFSAGCQGRAGSTGWPVAVTLSAGDTDSPDVTVMRAVHAIVSAAVLAVIAVASTGCASTVDGTATSRPTAGAPVPEPTIGATSSSPAVPSASSDLTECADGDCEVAITAPTSFALPDATFTVTELLTDGMVYEVALSPGATVGGSLRTSCRATLRQSRNGGSVTSTCDADNRQPVPPGAIELRLVEASPAGVVLRVTSA